MDEKAANHGELRMALVFRGDLDAMTRGKSEGQAAHAAFEAGITLVRTHPELVARYMADNQPKIVLEVDDEPSLDRVIAKAKARGVPVFDVTDAARTCFDAPTRTCAIIGPMTKTDSNAVTRGTSRRN